MQLVGQLYGGPSSCADESYDDYGAFATTYGSISSYLAAGSDDAYESNDTCGTARSVASGTYSNLVVKKRSIGVCILRERGRAGLRQPKRGSCPARVPGQGRS
jgi:hypothetical protein